MGAPSDVGSQRVTITSHDTIELDPYQIVTSKGLTIMPNGPSEPPLRYYHSFFMLQSKAVKPRRGAFYPVPASIWPVAPGPGWMARPWVSREIQCNEPGSQSAPRTGKVYAGLQRTGWLWIVRVNLSLLGCCCREKASIPIHKKIKMQCGL